MHVLLNVSSTEKNQPNSSDPDARQVDHHHHSSVLIIVECWYSAGGTNFELSNGFRSNSKEYTVSVCSQLCQREYDEFRKRFYSGSVIRLEIKMRLGQIKIITVVRLGYSWFDTLRSSHLLVIYVINKLVIIIFVPPTIDFDLERIQDESSNRPIWQFWVHYANRKCQWMENYYLLLTWGEIIIQEIIIKDRYKRTLIIGAIFHQYLTNCETDPIAICDDVKATLITVELYC